ncbi:MAG: hypothetical protein IJB81_05040 [Clostridia bacterium]|nr:hypothetical protein [Clostridia bacterium]
MKKRLMLALMLILCAMLLASCGDSQKFPVTSSPSDGQSGAANKPQQNNATQEWAGVALPTQVVTTATPAPTVRSVYAGATPVVLDPIDKPTPTPVPKLSVTYTAYDAVKLGLSFEGPAGWLKDDSAADTFIIQNPNARIDYPATLTLRAQQVSTNYSSSDLKSIVKGMLDSIETAGFDRYDPSSTASRDLLGKSGVYANYEGTLNDGREVYGRVHAVCVDKVLYTIHLTAPRAQWNDYKEMVYDHMRDTLVIVK